MTLAKRVERLEKAEVFADRQRLLDRLEHALNGTALRITGKLFNVVSGDPAIQKLIFDDLEKRFIRNLSDAELDLLAEELGHIAFGDNTAALEAAKSKAMRLSSGGAGGKVGQMIEDEIR